MDYGKMEQKTTRVGFPLYISTETFNLGHFRTYINLNAKPPSPLPPFTVLYNNTFFLLFLAIRGKLKKSHTHQLTFKKLKLFKADMDSITQLKNEMFTLNGTEECCREKIRENHSSYFIMGTYKDNRLNPTFIMPWEVKRSKVKFVFSFTNLTRRSFLLTGKKI